MLILVSLVLRQSRSLLHADRIPNTSYTLRLYSTSCGVSHARALTSSLLFSEQSAYFTRFDSFVGSNAALPSASASRAPSKPPYSHSESSVISKKSRSPVKVKHRTGLELVSCPVSGASRLQDGKYPTKVLARGLIRRLPQSNPIDAKLKPIQSEALKKFYSRISNIRSIRLKKDSCLKSFLRLFDDCFLRGLLGNWIDVKWAEGRPNQPAWSGRATLQTDVRGHQRIIIRIVKPSGGHWSETTIQGVLATLLVEMVNAVFLLHACRCLSCLGLGQELSKAKLLTALEDEANRSLTGFTKPWQPKDPFGDSDSGQPK